MIQMDSALKYPKKSNVYKKAKAIMDAFHNKTKAKTQEFKDEKVKAIATAGTAKSEEDEKKSSNG